MPKPPCSACGSKCCKYIATAIDTPSSKRDYDHIRWYLLHKNVQVFIDLEGVWFLEFVTPCRALDAKGRCTAYESRPGICRVYGSESDSDDCEYFDTPYKVCFFSVADFERWLEGKRSGPGKKKSAASKRRTPVTQD